MYAKRIIPCLDIKDGRVVKGVNFVDLRDAGDPVEVAAAYSREGADEVVFLDITATHEGRATVVDLAARVAEQLSIPFTVGGGIRTVEDFHDILRQGADKISINSAAIERPGLISEAAERFGSQCVVVGIDAKRSGKGGYNVFINGGRVDMNLDLGDWVKEIEERGAGEICLNSIDTDGVRGGFDLDMLNFVCSRVKIPVIASGGCGSIDHFSEVFEKTASSAALAASLFHFGELTVDEVKEHLRQHNIPVRTSARA